MKKTHRIIIYIIIWVIVYVTGSHYGRLVIDGYRDYKDRMYRDFQSFGTELEYLNDEVSNILVLKKYKFNKEKILINKNIVWNFHLSNCDAADMKDKRHYKDYQYTWMYYDANDVMQMILSDGIVTPSEEKYLKSLYDYTDHLIKAYTLRKNKKDRVLLRKEISFLFYSTILV
jgi:hypothetical protein